MSAIGKQIADLESQVSAYQAATKKLIAGAVKDEEPGQFIVSEAALSALAACLPVQDVSDMIAEAKIDQP